MLPKLRSRLTFANVGVMIALFFALGGPSFAADAVGHAAQLISGKQIKDSYLTTKDVKNGSLLKQDFKAGQLPAGPQGPQGSQGPQGPPGERGPQGLQGAAGATNVVMRRSDGATVDTGIINQDVFCEPGERATGGGWEWSGYTSGRYPIKSHPINQQNTAPTPGATPIGWTAAGYKGDAPGTLRTFYAWVLCASP